MSKQCFPFLITVFWVILIPFNLSSQYVWNPYYPLSEISESVFYTSSYIPNRTTGLSSDSRLNFIQKSYEYKRPKRLNELDHYYQRNDNETEIFSRKNAVWIGIMTINFGRIFPIGKSTALSISAGGSFLDQNTIPFTQIETNLLLGNGKHFFEPGLFFFTDYNEAFLLVRVGYRYQHPKGLLIRLAPLILFGDDFTVLPSVCIGYAF